MLAKSRKSFQIFLIREISKPLDRETNNVISFGQSNKAEHNKKYFIGGNYIDDKFVLVVRLNWI
jgi:hypothetical protein